MKDLFEAHWAYIKKVLSLSIPSDKVFTKEEAINIIGFHYTTAMEHGYKHGEQDALACPTLTNKEVDNGIDFPDNGNFGFDINYLSTDR